MEKPKDRLKQARAAAGYETPSDAARAHPRDINVNTLISNENGNRDISRKAAEKYAKLFGVTAGWILYGEDPGAGIIPYAAPPGLRRVEVAAHVQAGAWCETWEWDEADRYAVMIPDYPEYQGFRLYAAEARGTSMNRRYIEGTVLVFVDVNETREEPIPGKRYIVERKRASGEAEHTVKLLHVDAEGKFWLMPESDDPRHQAPIPIEDGTGNEDVVAIIGRVIAAVTRE